MFYKRHKNMGKRKSIKTDNFKIENNIISFNNTILQISNISQISVEPEPKKKFNFWSILLIIAAIFSVFIAIKIDNNLIRFIFGFLGLIMYFVFYIYTSFFIDLGDRKEKYLYIYLNSGNVHYFPCSNILFQKSVTEVIENCINNHYVNEIKVDFVNCKITNSPIAVVNNNSININSSFGNISWDKLQDEFIEVLGKLPKSSKEYVASKNALNCAMKEDKSGLIDVLKKNSTSFLSDIFKGVASGLLVEVIKYMML